jgi:hypothetical protein
MIVFEGCRNTGKTFLSKTVETSLSLPRYQYNFYDVYNSLNIKDHNPLSVHDFSLGKETMIMQLNKERLIPANMIHDRGFLTVLSWGISQKRITKEEALDQFLYFKNSGLLNDTIVIYIEGKNPMQELRNKDIWDETEKSKGETEAYEFLIEQIHRICSDVPGFSFLRFKNNFDDDSSKKIIKYVRNIIDPQG